MRDEDIEYLQHDNERLIAERDRIATYASQLEASAQHLRAMAERLEADLAAIRGSHSWLITRPIRVITRLLKRTVTPREAIELAKSELRGIAHRFWPSERIADRSSIRTDIDEVLLELKAALARPTQPRDG
jgi:hypothetical protein